MNFVRKVFEIGDKMLTLSSMENLIVQCNLKGFYHIWAWRPSWSCDPDAANKISLGVPKEAPHKIWL